MNDFAAFRLTYHRDGADVVVEVHGEVDIATAPHLWYGLGELIEDQGNLSIVVDLAHLAFIDCTGLTVLIRVRQRLRAKHGHLHLRAVPPTARRILDITGLLAAFDDHDGDAVVVEAEPEILDLRDLPATIVARGA